MKHDENIFANTYNATIALMYRLRERDDLTIETRDELIEFAIDVLRDSTRVDANVNDVNSMCDDVRAMLRNEFAL